MSPIITENVVIQDEATSERNNSHEGSGSASNVEKPKTDEGSDAVM